MPWSASRFKYHNPGARHMFFARRHARTLVSACIVCDPRPLLTITMSGDLARLATVLADRYRIERELGAGGMARVYLAEDVRHHRKVAIKVLHPELSLVLGPERFFKEIELTASLQHPHIVPLFDSGTADGLLFYVMPYVEGETLRGRLDRERQLPIADALRIAIDVADALEYAHKRGVIHRDVKPENVLMHEGRPLVADFGIALALQQAGGERMTQTGLSLGTPQYMAPEQAMGERNVDHRTDIYALGAVTYEMLAGEPPFTGPSAQAIVAKVMTEKPRPLRSLREMVSEQTEAAIATALQKLPADRFASAGEFAAALRLVGSQTTQGAARAPRPAYARPLRRASALGAALIIAMAGGWALRGLQAPSKAISPTRRAVLPMSPQFDVRGSGLSISADGSTIAATDGGAVMVRRLDRQDPIAIAAGAPGIAPFLSDDGQRIGLSRGKTLVIERVGGGDVTTISDETVGDGAFVDNNRIVVIDSAGLVLINLRSGARQVLMVPPPGINLLQPCVVPGGRHVALTAVGGNLATARVVSVDIDSRRVDTIPIGAALRPQVSGGWLYFARPTGELNVIRFDPKAMRVSGDPIPTGDVIVLARGGRGAFAAASGVFVNGQRPRNQVVSLGTDGRKTVLTDEPGAYHNPRVSPDGRRIVLDRDQGGSLGRDVWILDVATHALSRATSLGDAHDPVWTPDGRRATYLSFRTPGGPIITSSADGAPGEQKLFLRGTVNPGQWLANGRVYIAGVQGATGGDIVAINAADNKVESLVASRYDEHSPAVSPDGRLLAYTSDETGRPQIYVRPLHADGARVLVSETDGEEPVWSRRGRELYYIEQRGTASRLLSVRFTNDAEPRELARSVVLENLRFEPVGNHANWDVMPDGRLVFIEPMEGTQLVVVFDWVPPTEVKR